jgi:hypothetical protein
MKNIILINQRTTKRMKASDTHLKYEEKMLRLDAAPNKRMQWSAASESHRVPSVLCAAPTDARR